MMDGTLETIDGRQALRFERPLPHPQDRVWRAVTEPAELARWFVAPAPWTPKADEEFEAAGQTGRITGFEPPRLLAWEWGRERYSFEVLPEGEGCRLVFIHFFDPSLGPGVQHAGGWESYLLRLEAILDGGELTEADAHRIVPELNERYAVAFGEDGGPGRASFAKYGPLQVELAEPRVLRFERRYGYSVERVWRAISDPAERRHWFPSDAPLEVTESEEPTLLAGTFHDTPVRFELRPDGAGCVLVFTHEFESPEQSAMTAAGWDRCFTRMDALLAGSELGERESLELWPVVHERYAERFGIDPEIGRTAFAEHG